MGQEGFELVATHFLERTVQPADEVLEIRSIGYECFLSETLDLRIEEVLLEQFGVRDGPVSRRRRFAHSSHTQPCGVLWTRP